MARTVRRDEQDKAVAEAVEERLGRAVLEEAKSIALADALQSTDYRSQLRALQRQLRQAYLQKLRTLLRDESFLYEDETPIPESVVRRARKMGASESDVPEGAKIP